MGHINKFLKQTIFYGLSSVVARVLNFLLVPLYTAIFLPVEYGVVSEMYAYAAFLMIFSTLGIETAFFKFSNEKENKKNVSSAASFLLLISSFFFIFLATFFSGSISEIIGGIDAEKYKDYIFYFLMIIAIDTLCVVPFSQLRLQEKASYFALIKTINILVNIGFNLFFYIYLEKTTIDYVFISNLFASTITLLILIPNIENYSFNLGISKRMLRYSYPLIIGGLAYAINETADKILIKYLCTNNPMEQLGIYSACYKLSIFMVLFVQSYRLAAEPVFFNYQKNKNNKKIYAQIMRVYIIISMLVFLLVALNIEHLKFFISDSSYHSGLVVVPIILLGHVCLGVYYNLSLWYKLTDQTKYGAMISIFGCFVTIIINLIFLPTQGYIASAWATLICYLLMMLVSYFLGQRKYPIPYEIKPIFLYVTFAIIIYIVHYYLALSGITNMVFLVSIYLIIVVFVEGLYKKIKLSIK